MFDCCQWYQLFSDDFSLLKIHCKKLKKYLTKFLILCIKIQTIFLPCRETLTIREFPLPLWERVRVRGYKLIFDVYYNHRNKYF